MPLRLDRLVELRVQPANVATPANGGLTNAGTIAGFRIVAERHGFTSIVGDTYIVAMGADGRAVTGAVTGSWLAGSSLSWRVPSGDSRNEGVSQATVLQRTIEWTMSTYSLRYGAPHQRRRFDSAATIVPSITLPAWDAVTATWGTISGRTVTGGSVLNVSAVRPSAGRSTIKLWALKLEEFYAQTSVTEGARSITRIHGQSTWRMRFNAQVQPFATLIDGNETWQVSGVRSITARARHMEVECQRELER